MSLAVQCDRDSCDTWQRIPTENNQWLTISDTAKTYHFCCLDCVMHWAAANSEPTEVFNEGEPS